MNTVEAVVVLYELIEECRHHKKSRSFIGKADEALATLTALVVSQPPSG